MAANIQPDHAGLQVVQHSGATKYPHHEGLNYVPHSDKQAVYFSTTDKEAYHKNGLSSGYPYEVGDERGRPTKQKHYCGLSKRAFIIALVVVVLVVVAVGGGVGGSLASKKSQPSNTIVSSSTSSAPVMATTTNSKTKSSSSATNTVSSRTKTSSSSTAQPTSGMGAYDCPAQNDTTYVSSLSSSYKFLIACNRDSVGGAPGINGGTVIDLTPKGTLADSIQACIDACVASTLGGTTCKACSYGANITLALQRGGIVGNCFLKNQRAASLSIDSTGQAITAYLDQ